MIFSLSERYKDENIKEKIPLNSNIPCAPSNIPFDTLLIILFLFSLSIFFSFFSESFSIKLINVLTEKVKYIKNKKVIEKVIAIYKYYIFNSLLLL